ncbi:hypothetical protein BJV77DRAFT_1072711 [Russula vinacea]|nr:hypothetical protein BJV77DRAFT_1072711 [Russula vinacea]
MSCDDDNDECFLVQLDGSDMCPRAPKTILRQRFTMRRYNLEHDGRLTNLAKAIEWPVDDLACCSTSSTNAADMVTESIMTILQPHTSSPSLHIIARAITQLIAGKFGDDDLCQILNARLDTLSICPQAKQGIVPAIVSIAKLTGVQP